LRQGNWNYRNSLDSVELDGKTLFIVGFGRIGRRMAEIAHVFGMKTLAFDSYLAPDAIFNCGVTPVSNLEEGLVRADIVTLHIPPMGEGTLMGKKELGLMKKGAILINTARGALVDGEPVCLQIDDVAKWRESFPLQRF